MKIIQVHNRYLQPGGEDAVVAAERSMLEAHGHEVMLFERSNREIDGWSPLQKIVRVLWNRQACLELEALIASFKPDVLHVHNVFHAISLSVYQAARRNGVPVVQTLHNYRLFCLNGIFFREGQVCEACLRYRFFPWAGVRHRCYRRSLSGSFLVAAMLAIHRAGRTWIAPVNRFIVLTDFCREKFIQCGIPPEKIAVKPNFVSQDPGSGAEVRDPQILFLGRLTDEKGVRTLLKAWALFREGAAASAESAAGPDLFIAGDGPLAAELSGDCGAGVKRLGQIDRSTSIHLLKTVRALVFPSEWYETFGLSVVEAMACGTPVLVADANAAASLVRDRETGLLFRSGDCGDLAVKIEWMMKHPEECAAMGRAARQEYEKKYTAEANYEGLMDIYRQVVGEGQVHS